MTSGGGGRDATRPHLTVGIASGCLAEHFNVPEGLHFQELLPAIAGERYGRDVRVVVDSSHGMPFLWRASSLAAQGADVVILQVRLAVLVYRSRLFSGGSRPPTVVARRRRRERAQASRFRAVLEATRRGLLAADIAAGVLAGRAGGRAVPEEVRRTLTALDYLEGRGLAAVVVGPVPATHWRAPGRHVWRLTDAALRRAAAAGDFPYLSFADGWRHGESLDVDGIHLTRAGQRDLAMRLADAIERGVLGSAP